MIVFHITYRARGTQTFRRDQLIGAIANIKEYFTKNNIPYKIVISEQNDSEPFNRGKLLNAAFLESEKLFNFEKKYFHFNTDYLFDLSRNFPDELHLFTKGFLDVHRTYTDLSVLGGACLFDSESYKLINGFPNDLVGWGGDDWAIYKRIIEKGINIYVPEGLFNSGYIIEEDNAFCRDNFNSCMNSELSFRNDTDINGLNTCKYSIDGFGEFNDSDIIYHFLVNFL
jgi:hypothetical protein